MKNLLTSVVLATSFIAAATTANASGSDSKQFKVKVTVHESCTIASAADIDFATIDRSTATDLTSQGQLDVTCTLGTPYKVALVGKGEMGNANSKSVIPYKLFQDSNYETIWNEQNMLNNTGTGNNQTLPVYAQLDGNTNVEAGDYMDTVIATVTY